MKDNNIANDYLDNSEIELSRIFYLTSLKASRNSAAVTGSAS